MMLLLSTFSLLMLMGAIAVPGEILVTDFTDLYVNNLGYLQTDQGTLNVYEKLPNGGARFNFKPGSNWFTFVSDYSTNFCLSGEGAIVRITGAGFKKNDISFNLYPSAPKNGRCDSSEAGQIYPKFFSGSLIKNDSVSGREIMDFDLDTIEQDLRKLKIISFDFNLNVNITLYSISILYKQLGSTSTQSSLYSSYAPLATSISVTSSITDPNSVNTLLIYFIGGGGLVLLALFAWGIRIVRRRKHLKSSSALIVQPIAKTGDSRFGNPKTSNMYVPHSNSNFMSAGQFPIRNDTFINQMKSGSGSSHSEPNQETFTLQSTGGKSFLHASP